MGNIMKIENRPFLLWAYSYNETDINTNTHAEMHRGTGVNAYRELNVLWNDMVGKKPQFYLLGSGQAIFIRKFLAENTQSAANYFNKDRRASEYVQKIVKTPTPV